MIYKQTEAPAPLNKHPDPIGFCSRSACALGKLRGGRSPTTGAKAIVANLTRWAVDTRLAALFTGIQPLIAAERNLALGVTAASGHPILRAAIASFRQSRDTCLNNAVAAEFCLTRRAATIAIHLVAVLALLAWLLHAVAAGFYLAGRRTAVIRNQVPVIAGFRKHPETVAAAFDHASGGTAVEICSIAIVACLV